MKFRPVYRRISIVAIVALATLIAPPPAFGAVTVVAQDDFSRSVSSGWGSANVGGAWSAPASSTYFVDGTAGGFTHSAGMTLRADLNVDVADVDVTVKTSVDKPPTGSGTYAGIVVRKVGSDYYKVRVRFLPGGNVALQLMHGASTRLADVPISGLSYSPGDELEVHVAVTGANPATIQASVWKTGASEPGSWQLSETDASSALQGAGGLGLEGYASSGATNAPVTVKYDDYLATTTSAVVPPAEEPAPPAEEPAPPAADPTPFAVTGPVAAQDSFGRTVSNGWGTADVGGAWSTSALSTYFVNNGSGGFTHSAGMTRRADLNGVSISDVDVTLQVSVDKAPTGSGVYAGVVVRKVGSDYYKVRARFLPGGAVALQLMHGASTLLANVTVAGLNYSPGSQLSMRVSVTGTSPTTIGAKAWLSSSSEPSSWTLSLSDSSSGLQQAGALGLEGYVSSGATNAPITVRYDNYVASGDTSGTPTPPPPAPTPAPTSGLVVAIIGDMPYGSSQLTMLPGRIDQMNADSQVNLAAHLGDISSPLNCSTSYYQTIKGQFDRFADPLVYTPGDNEWADCSRAAVGAGDPLSKLSTLRSVFYPTPGKTLGISKLTVTAQSGYPENVRFNAGGITLGTIHAVGSFNDLATWSGNSSTTAAQQAEFNARQSANVSWIKSIFSQAKSANARAVVLMMQADMFHPGDISLLPSVYKTAFQALVRELATQSASFGKPVLLLNGDTHGYKSDKPLTSSSWTSYYGTSSVSNLSRITVKGGSTADEWLKLTIVSGSSVWTTQRVKFN